MPDYAGAKAAIRARFDANWTVTRKAYQNEQPATPWPPVDGNGLLVAWTMLEIVGTGSDIEGAGTPQNHVWSYTGNILVHVFVPVGTSDDLGTQYAVTIGEIFRAKKFYDDVPGYYVRTLAPSINDGGSADDDGNWFVTTMSVDFTYWHRG